MQENEFEKQVKSTIDEFMLRPSAPVWMNIREEIREKRRRRILLMIPVLAVILGLGYFTWQSYYHNNKTDSLQENNELTDKKENKDADLKTIEQNKTGEIKKEKDVVDNNKPDDKSPATSTESKTVHVDRIIADKKVTAANKKTITNVQSHLSAANKQHISGNKELKPGITSQIAKKELNVEPGLFAMNKKKNENHVETPVSAETQDNSSGQTLQTDNIPVPLEYNLRDYSVRNTINSNELIIAEIPSLKNNNDFKSTGKIKWGIDFSVGSSSRIEQPFKVVSADKAASISGNFNNSPVSLGTTTTVSGGLLVLPPSDVKPGVSFKIGVVVEKSVSRRLSFSTGLRYVYASDKISIGKSIYPAQNLLALQNMNYFAGGSVAQTSSAGMQAKNFTNKYHFIELPVMVHFNLIPKWKTPVTWNAGAAISRMISSDALLYDEAWGGVYHNGANNFLKTQFNITTGFSVHFTGSNKWQWSIGPEVSMYTSKLFQSVSDKNNHSVYGGINFQLLLPHNKR